MNAFPQRLLNLLLEWVKLIFDLNKKEKGRLHDNGVNTNRIKLIKQFLINNFQFNSCFEIYKKFILTNTASEVHFIQ